METGSNLLNDWLRANGRRKGWFAAQIPVNPATLTRWLTGASTPYPVARERIAEITGGAVIAEVWTK